MSALTVTPKTSTRGAKDDATALPASLLKNGARPAPVSAPANRSDRVRPRSPRPSATVVSIEEARRRLRGTSALDLSISRHPSSRGASLRGRNLKNDVRATAVPIVHEVSPRAARVQRPNMASSSLPVLASDAVDLGVRPVAVASPRPSAAISIKTLVKVAAGIMLTLALFAASLAAGLLLRPAEFTGDTWVHSVSQGESVWGLAESLGLARPLEGVVEDIYALNALSDATLQPGQQILLPAE